ncbi:replication-associated recombination protein A [Oceaniserpentilla sp. 4NH20-0058]|uniref:replication-associated recombination protein A n=1 Tax=Oceaniserpentilla sp. 4NH20-0058 TaxID=3127660 RepID=UPI003105ED5B
MQDSLFASEPAFEPLASRARPSTLDGYFGQEHLLGEEKALRRVIESGVLHSMIFWGPPGVGKTTLAQILANYADAEFLSLSAVLDGVKDIRQCMEKAKEVRQQGRKSLLFVDEVHRFNKSQQDAFLPFVENGTVIFIGATTENPSFELNSALLSRARVYKLRGLSAHSIGQMLTSVMASDQLLKEANMGLADDALEFISVLADGDARKALNILEMSCDLALADDLDLISLTIAQEVAQESVRRFDKGGDLFYEQISALHKSVRGSSPDGAMYWYCRMIDGGCDPIYIARRLIRMASEDIGNADPRALEISMNAWQAYERLGSPEGELIIAHAVNYLACAPKSNAVYKAFNETNALIRSTASYEVPLHLRNAPTKLMKDEEYGQEYRYAHDEQGAYAAGECYLPVELKDLSIYKPTDRGLEFKIGEKLKHLAHLDELSQTKRYE